MPELAPLATGIAPFQMQDRRELVDLLLDGRDIARRIRGVRWPQLRAVEHYCGGAGLALRVRRAASASREACARSAGIAMVRPNAPSPPVQRAPATRNVPAWSAIDAGGNHTIAVPSAM